jgi:hypothetical protein
MSIKQNSLGILCASIVLECTTIETGLFTKAGNSLSIILGKSVHKEDSFSYIRGAHKIDLEELCLQMTLIWSVASQCLQEEGGSLLNSSIFKENLDYTVNSSLGDISSVTIGNHLSKLNSSLRINWDYVTENLDKIRAIVNLLAVRHNLIVLASLNETLNDTVR